MTRAFQLWTSHGSMFVARFDPQGEEQGLAYGRMDVIGDSQLLGRRVRIQGLAWAPEVQSRIVVDDRPLETVTIEGESVPIYPTEEIVKVVELAVEAEQIRLLAAAHPSP